MILHLCDYCGRETKAGRNVPDQHIRTNFDLSKKWRGSHTESRASRISVLIGIDGTVPEVRERVGHDLCGKCQATLLRVLADRIEATS